MYSYDNENLEYIVKKISKKRRWKCKISLSEGLSNTLDWYLKNKKNYRNKKSHYLKRKGKN